jgi:hypothetical protein
MSEDRGLPEEPASNSLPYPKFKVGCGGIVFVGVLLLLAWFAFLVVYALTHLSDIKI